jgi:hypothetical protein
MTRQTLLPFLLIALAIGAAPSRARQTASRPAATAPVTIPFELVTRHIMVKVRINNSRPLSSCSTPSSGRAVDIEVAKELGLKLQGSPPAGAGRGLCLIDGAGRYPDAARIEGFS